MKQYTLLHGDCLDRLKELPDNSVDSIVTDPPYGLSFMGKKWDYDVPSEDVWRECLRVLKPGGHLLAFAGTRTQHRMAVRIEDAGFEIRDMIAWIYGSGFPKSLDISKAIDKAAGAEREVIGRKGLNSYKSKNDGNSRGAGLREEFDRVDELTAPATEEARQWQGWGTALKPALEPITVARKPLIEKTVAENVLKHGTGGINVDGCRVATDEKLSIGSNNHEGKAVNFGMKDNKEAQEQNPLGRFPANLVHDGSEEVLAEFPDTKSGKAVVGTGRDGNYSKGIYGAKQSKIASCFADEGSAARFFYCAKASKRDRNEGLPDNGASTHPTVKPCSLMQYLCRLVTPPNGTVLDPFMGSGSTGKAAMYEGFDFIGIEREQEYMEISRARIEFAANDNEPDEPIDNQLSLFE